MRLYHYACQCSKREITDRGFLLPRSGAAFAGIDLVWLTDLQIPDRRALGLTSHRLSCDRLSFQYLVDVEPDATIEPWLTGAVRRYLTERCALSFADFGHEHEPARWWIAVVPVFAVRNRAYVNPDPLPAARRPFALEARSAL